MTGDGSRLEEQWSRRTVEWEGDKKAEEKQNKVVQLQREGVANRKSIAVAGEVVVVQQRRKRWPS